MRYGKDRLVVSERREVVCWPLLLITVVIIMGLSQVCAMAGVSLWL